MFPKTSTFKSPEGGAAWWNTVAPTDKAVLVWQTQWWTVVRLFRQHVKEILLKQNVYTFAVNPEGTCWSGSMSEIPAGLQATSHNTSDIAVTGVWDDESSDLLAAMLCLTGDTDAAKQAHVDGLQRKVSAATMRFILWLTFMVPTESVNLAADAGQPKVAQNVRDNGGGIVIPNDAVMPTWDDKAEPDSRDQNWFVMSFAGQPLPNPPSIGGGTRPWPTSAPGVAQNAALTRVAPPPSPSSSGGIGIMGMGILIGGGLLALGALGSGAAAGAAAASGGKGIELVDDPKPKGLGAGLAEHRAMRRNRANVEMPGWSRLPHHNAVGEAMTHAAKMRPPGTVVVERPHVSLDRAMADMKHAAKLRPGAHVTVVEAQERLLSGVAYGARRGPHGLTYEDALEVIERAEHEADRRSGTLPHGFRAKAGVLKDGPFTRKMQAAEIAKELREKIVLGKPIPRHKDLPANDHSAREKEAVAFGKRMGAYGKMPTLTAMKKKGFSSHQETLAERAAAETIERNAHRRLHGGSQTRGEKDAIAYGERVGRLGKMPDTDKMRAQKYTWEEIALAQEAAADRIEHRASAG